MLKNRYDLVFSKIPSQDWRFFHRKSVRNFIHFLPHIKGRSERVEIEALLNSYFDRIETLDSKQYNITVSMELFDNYVYPIAQKFEWRLGFVAISTFRGLFFLFPLALCVVYFVRKLSESVFFLFLFIVVVYMIRLGHKASHKKVYGFGY